MRHILLASCMTILVSCGSELDVSQIDMSPEFVPGVEEFFSRCHGTRYQSNCRYALKTLHSIKWKHLDSPVVGLNTKKHAWVRRSNSVVDRMTPMYQVVQTIYVDPDVKEFKGILFHELGHSVGQEHDDSSCLMGEYVTKEATEKARNKWDLCVMELFTKPHDRPDFRMRTGL